MHLEGKTLVNLVSIPLHFNVLIMFGWEKFGELTDNRQIRQCFPLPTFCAIRSLHAYVSGCKITVDDGLSRLQKLKSVCRVFAIVQKIHHRTYNR